MEQHYDQITTSWSLLVEMEENSFQSLKEENQALRERVAQLQQSENQLQKDLQREMKKRRTHSKAYLDCMNLLTEETMELEVCEARWEAKLKVLDLSLEKEMFVRENVWRRRVKELERERQVDKERLQKMEEKQRTVETRANELICELQNQIQDLDQSVLESRWKKKPSELNASAQRQLALRDDVWRRRVTELEQQKRRETEEWLRKEDVWKTEERWEKKLICELQQQVKLLKERERDWWMMGNQLTYQLWT